MESVNNVFRERFDEGLFEAYHGLFIRFPGKTARRKKAGRRDRLNGPAIFSRPWQNLRDRIEDSRSRHAANGRSEAGSGVFSGRG